MPTTTTEAEIFEVLADSLKSAAEDCAKLAWDPRRGHVYERFRNALSRIDGCCQQAYYWRNYDARWLELGLLVGFVHQRAGNWLRFSVREWERKIAQPEFAWLAERLSKMAYEAERIRTAATGKIGPIMPEPLPGPHRESRPVQVPASPLLLPPGFVDERKRANG